MARCLRRCARIGRSSETSFVVVVIALLFLLPASACASRPRSVEPPSASREVQPEFGPAIGPSHPYEATTCRPTANASFGSNDPVRQRLKPLLCPRPCW